MASFIDDLYRNMLPLWRSYDDTSLVRELEFTGHRILPVRFDRYGDFKEAWDNKHTIISAADLVNAAVASGNTSGPETLSAAEFMLHHQQECSPLAIDVAKSIIEPREIQNDIETSKKKPTFEERVSDLISGLTNQENETKARIGLLRKQIYNHCYNPIAYCELSRCYASLGYDKKAEQYMDYAVFLAPQSRYIVRSAVRFYIHIKEFGKAKKAIFHSGLINNDPWVMSAEIALESLMGKNSRYIIKGRQLVFSGDISPFSCSELCFSICNVDKAYGKRKDVRRMFYRGIEDPNDNSLAQATFFAKNDDDFIVDLAKFNSLKHKNEADMRKSFGMGDFEGAFVSSLLWMQDYRFEHRPIEYAFIISCDFLKKYEYAISIINKSLKTNPKDPVSVNNLAYALGLSDRTSEAEKALSAIDIKKLPKDNNPNYICLAATWGLVAYRKGETNAGREMYNLAIQAAKKLGDDNLMVKAKLNMIREEIRSSVEVDEKLLKEMESLRTEGNAETQQLKKDILVEVDKKKGSK